MNAHPPILEADDEFSPRDGYAAWAPCYDEDGNPLIALEGPAMRALFGRVGGRSVLDVGCGTGRLTLALAEAGARVVAIDQSPEMMARARTKLHGRAVSFVQHALPGPLPFADGQFALAVLGLVAEHVDDLQAVMAEVARAVEPGGRCLVSALHPDRTAEGQRARFIDPQTGVRRPIATIHRTLDDYRRIFESAGWTLAEEQSLVVPESIIEEYPRASRYVGRNLGWVSCWSRMG